MLDADAGTLSYAINGESQGVAFKNIKGTSAGLYPVASLQRRQRLVFNFGEEVSVTSCLTLTIAQEFCFPMDDSGYSGLYLKMTNEEKANLVKLFEHYKGTIWREI